MHELLPIVVCALSGVLIGALWYQERLWGARWRAEMRFSPQNVEARMRHVYLRTLADVLVHAVLAYAVLALFAALEVRTLKAAFPIVMLLFFGIILPVLATRFLNEEKSFAFFSIESGYWFVCLSVNSCILIVSLYA